MVWGQVNAGKFLQLVPGGIIGSSLPPFFIIAFEMMVLFGGFGPSSHGRARPLPRLKASASFDPGSPTTASGWRSTAPGAPAAVHELCEPPRRRSEVAMRGRAA